MTHALSREKTTLAPTEFLADLLIPCFCIAFVDATKVPNSPKPFEDFEAHNIFVGITLIRVLV
jgi:hypothetical protein